MAIGEDEAITVEVVRVCGRVFHGVFPEGDTDCCHAHCTAEGELLVVKVVQVYENSASHPG